MSVAAAPGEVGRSPAPAEASPRPQGAAPTRNPLSRSLLAWTHLMGRYHSHRLLHAERLERTLAAGRPVVLLGNHGPDVVDTLLLATALREQLGRTLALVVHPNVFFSVSWMRSVRALWPSVPSGDERAAARGLEEHGILLIYPDGASDAGARSHREEPYRLHWEGKLGFLRLALAANAEIHFVAAVGVEEMYFETRLRAPRLLRRYCLPGCAGGQGAGRVQLGLAGPRLFPALFPLPVELTHVVSPLVPLPDRHEAQRSPYALLRLQLQVRTWCQRFLDDELAWRQDRAGRLDRMVRRAQEVVYRLAP